MKLLSKTAAAALICAMIFSSAVTGAAAAESLSGCYAESEEGLLYSDRGSILSLRSDVLADTSIRPQESVKNTNYGSAQKILTNAGAVGLFRLDLSAVPEGYSVLKAEFSFTVQTSGKPVYTVAEMPDDWDEKSETYVTYTKKHGADFIGNEIGRYSVYASENSGTYNDVAAAADITSYIEGCVKKGLKEVTIGIYYSSVFSVYSREYSAAKPALLIECAKPSVRVVSSTPENGAVTELDECDITMKLATELDGAALPFISLVKHGDGGEVEADIAVNGSLVTISLKSTPEVSTRYDVIFKTGLSDIYGNKTQEDLCMLTFTTWACALKGEIKLTADISPSFDSCKAAASVSAGSTVSAVAKIKNLSDREASATVFICVYKGKRLLSMKAVSESVLPLAEGREITVCAKLSEYPEADRVSAFIWDDAFYMRLLGEAANADVI